MDRKKVLFIVCISLICLMFVACTNRGLPLAELSEDNIKAHLETLTRFEGRKVGTEGNEKTVEYIEEYFKEIGLEPIEEDKYTSEFDAITYNWDGEPIFNLIDDNGNIIKSYKDREDYKIRFDGIAIGGKFNGYMEHINRTEQINKNEFKFEDKAVLIDYIYPEVVESSFEGALLDDRVYYDGAKVLIYPEYEDIDKLNIDLGSKNKMITKSGLIKLGVSKDVYDELLDYYEKGYKLDIDIPISFEESRAKNIAGVIRGRKKSYENTLVIATAIDGIGKNYDGKLYTNASDSGISTSLFLELARYMVDNNIKVDSDIVFLGVNAAESGYLGYQKFNRDKIFQYDKSEIIYLDDLAGNPKNELTIGSYIFENSSSQNNKLSLNKMVNVAEEQAIKFVKDEAYHNSKYIEFRNLGIITTILTYGESPLAKRLNDDISHVNFKDTKNAGELLLNYIDEYGNLNIWKELKGVFSSIYLYLILGVLLILFRLLYINKNQSSKLAIFFKNKPVITIYLIGLFIIFTVVLQTQNHIMINRGIIVENVVLDSQGFFEVISGTILYFGIMALLLIPSLGLTLGFIVLILGLKNKGKINTTMSLISIMVVSYILVLLNLNKFYNYGFAAIFPQIFALKYSSHIILMIVNLYTGLTIYILSREKNNLKDLRKIIYYILIFAIFVVILYSPYVVSKSLIELRNFNGILKF